MKNKRYIRFLKWFSDFNFNINSPCHRHPFGKSSLNKRGLYGKIRKPFCKQYIIKTLLIITSILLINNCTDLREDLNDIKYDNPIKIAFLGPVSVARTKVESRYLGAYLAAEEINNAGGINGRDIQLIEIDDGGTASTGISAVKKLHKENINLILGPTWSSVTLAIAPAFTIPNNMLVISYSATSPKISDLDDNNLVWRTAPSDAFQGKISANYAYKTLGIRKVAILAANEAWANGLANSFKNAFEKLGGNITNFVHFPQLSDDEILNYDFTPSLDKLFSQQPEAVLLATLVAAGVKITNDIVQDGYLKNNYMPQFLAGDSYNNSNFIANGHSKIVNNIIGTVPANAVDNMNFLKFSINYNARWGYNPQAFAANSYDALYLLAYAILKSNGSTNPLDIITHLRNVSGGNPNIQGTVINVNELKKGEGIINTGGNINYNGASGKIDFDANGDPGSGTYHIWRVENNKFKVIETVNFP